MKKNWKWLFGTQKQQCKINNVNHRSSKNEDWIYKDESWRNPFCQIIETSTGKVIKDFGVTRIRISSDK